MPEAKVMEEMLLLCGDNWRIYNAEQWAYGLATLLSGFDVAAGASEEEFGAAVRAHIAEGDNAPKAKDILERLKLARASRTSSSRKGENPSRAACPDCNGGGWIESQILELCRDGVERRRKPALVRCWGCMGGEGREQLRRGWAGLIESGGGQIVEIAWGSPMLHREAAAPVDPSTLHLRYTPNPEQHDPHRAERERTRKWAAEQLEAEATAADMKRGGASLEAILRAERLQRRAA